MKRSAHTLNHPSRRHVLGALASSLSAGVLSGACSAADAQIEPETVEGLDAGNLDALCTSTPRNVEGPFYVAGAPERQTLFEGEASGQIIEILGHVQSTSCVPLEGVRLDFWHATPEGEYQNSADISAAAEDEDPFHLRGVLFSSSDGSFQLTTLMPGRYLLTPGSELFRPAHVHLKASAAGFHSVTTQLYFPDDPFNEGDDFFLLPLLMEALEPGPNGELRFAFTLTLANQ